MRGKNSICAGAALLSLAALSLLVSPSGERRSSASPGSTAAPRVAAAAPGRQPRCVASVHCSGLLAPMTDPFAGERKTLAAAIASVDRPDATAAELLELGATLTRLLKARPELGEGAVAALEATRSRLVLFQLSHALRAVVAHPAIEQRLVAIATGQGTDEQREAAILTLGGRGDANALVALGDVIAADDAGPLARTAALYELGRDLSVVPATARDRALTTARGLAGDTATPAKLRAEALFLLGAGPLDASDRALAHAALADPAADVEVTLAAAHALLTSGEPGAPVAAALRGRAGGDPSLLAAAATLEKIPGRQP